MKKEYKHIALINPLTEDEWPWVIRKTMIYWMGKPTAKKATQAVIYMNEVSDYVKQSSVILSIKVVAIDFSLLTKTALANYILTFKNTGSSLMDTEGLPKSKFLQKYDDQIDSKMKELARSDSFNESMIRRMVVESMYD